MSCSFDKILSDVKNLTQRLKCTDETTNKIIKDTSYFYVKLKSMNQLQEKISLLSNSCNGGDKNEVSFEGSMENCNLEKLRMENVELCELLKEYETALELIMTRYRTDMNDFMRHSSMQPPPPFDSDYDSLRAIELDLTAKYVDLYKIAVESSANAERHVERLEKSIDTLHAENEAMRDILGLIECHLRCECERDSVPVPNAVAATSGPNAVASAADKLAQLSHSALKRNHIVLHNDDRKSSADHLFDSSFSDDDRCSVSSDASVKTLI